MHIGAAQQYHCPLSRLEVLILFPPFPWHPGMFPSVWHTYECTELLRCLYSVNLAQKSPPNPHGWCLQQSEGEEDWTEQTTCDKPRVLDNQQRHLSPTCHGKDWSQGLSPHAPLWLQGGRASMGGADKVASRVSSLQRKLKSVKRAHSRNSPGHVRVGGNKRCLG